MAGRLTRWSPRWCTTSATAWPRDHPWYDATVEFCERYDENCFDPGYDWLPLAHFVPAVEEVFRREPVFR